MLGTLTPTLTLTLTLTPTLPLILTPRTISSVDAILCYPMPEGWVLG